MRQVEPRGRVCTRKQALQRLDVRLREVADRIGITERAVIKIVADLEAEGLVLRHREGRRNTYELRLDHPLRHPVEKHRRVSELVDLILE